MAGRGPSSPLLASKMKHKRKAPASEHFYQPASVMNFNEPSPKQELSPDGGCFRDRASHRSRMAVRTEVGWISLPRFSRPRQPSRWSTKRSSEWEPLTPRLVVEVQFDHFAEGRFRHGTKLLRLRPDKAPKACTMIQVKRENRSALDLL